MVISLGQLAELPGEAFAACIIPARSTITVATPIAERFDNLLKPVIICKDGAAFTHRYMVRGIKA
jgi:hypothetical protein